MIDTIREILKTNDTFVITAHVNPDGDAVGSCLGLAMALRAAGKGIRVVLDGFAKKFAHLPGMEMVNAECLMLNVECGVLVCLDCANLDRLHVKERFNEFKVTINIDHHISNGNYAEYNYIDPSAASAAEVVLDLLDGDYPLTADIAEVLLLGLLSDTGGLSHANTNARALHNTARLIDAGADIAKIKKRILNMHTLPEAKIMARALHNVKMVADGRVSMSYLLIGDFDDVGATYADTDGIPEYMLEIEGAEIAVFFTERENGLIKINFRSMTVNVSDLAAKFGGGGHVNAAGASIEGNLHYVMNMVTECITAL
jgi:phosphoesterase RecJ-like protein